MNNLKSSQSNLKTLLAVGGWTHASVGFTEMVQSYDRRQQFIQYAIGYLKHHGEFNSITCIKSRPELFCEKGVLRNFAKFTGKQLCQSLCLITLQDWGLQLYSKRGSDTGVSLLNIYDVKF